ncbi:MAG: ribonuclease R [Planctomycetota bacterium]|jgi:ribonuclease R
MTSGKDSGTFGSFEDLLRSRGGKPSEEDEKQDAKEEKGWSVESDDGAAEFDDVELGKLPDLDEGVRAIISSRPRAGGAMESGPACYQDADSDEVELLSSFRLRTRFPKDVRDEVAKLPSDPPEADYVGRVDLRGERIFTIDGDDAKDYDDAIGIRALDGGGYEIGVHIADVAHYVTPGTVLDAEALARATSVYLPDQVIPMLPEELSNTLCSLVPKRPRLAYSVIMEFDAKGERTAARVHKSVIESVHRNTYRIVQELLDGKETEETAEIEFLAEDLRHFQRWTRKQQEIRDAKGSLRMQSRERKFQFDEKHEVKAIVDAPQYFSQTLIEETALAANQAVGDLFREKGLPTIYRVHPEKDEEEIERVTGMLEQFNIRVPRKERLTGRDIGRLIRAVRRLPNSEAMIQRIMGLIERAVYEVRDHENVAEHFGLARQAYLHFTSPIRRYPDLVVHRWLCSVETRGDEAADELRAEAMVQDLNDVAAHCSIKADVSKMTEQAVKDLKVCQFLDPHIGKRFDAKVHRVSRGGIEVYMPDFNVNAFLPSSSIGERPILKGSTLTINAGRRSLSFSEGYPIAVKIKEVDFLRLQVQLELP